MEKLMKKFKASLTDPEVEITKAEKYVLISKAVTSAANLSVGGTLNPQDANELYSVIAEGTVLANLKNISSGRMSKDLSVYATGKRRIRNPKTDLTDTVTGDPSNVGSIATLKIAQLLTSLDNESLVDNAYLGDAEFEAFLMDLMIKDYSKQIEDLAFNGTSDSGAYNADNDVRFLALNKGYVQIIKDRIANGAIAAENKPKVYDNGADTTMSDRVDGLIASARPELLSPSYAVFMSVADFHILAKENADAYTNMADKTGVPTPRFRGYEIITVPSLATEVHIFCEPMDLAVVYNINDTMVTVVPEPKRAQTDHIINAYYDFELIRGAAVSIGYDVP